MGACNVPFDFSIQTQFSHLTSLLKTTNVKENICTCNNIGGTFKNPCQLCALKPSVACGITSHALTSPLFTDKSVYWFKNVLSNVSSSSCTKVSEHFLSTAHRTKPQCLGVIKKAWLSKNSSVFSNDECCRSG